MKKKKEKNSLVKHVADKTSTITGETKKVEKTLS